VISGYLITGLLLKETEQGLKKGLLDFYRRRIIRLHPALILIMTSSLVAGYLLLTDEEYRRLGLQILFGAGFSVNYLFATEGGYFDLPAINKPMLHLWSLAVEEQFYLVYPVLLWAAAITSRPAALLLAGSCASFALWLALTTIWPSLSFYGLPTRSWELLLGSVLNWAPRARARWMREGLSIAGLVLVVLAVFGIKAGMYPGWSALVPTFGAMAVISAGPDAIGNRRLLGLRLFVGVGLISYPLYLWHWPLISFGAILSDAAPSIWSRGAIALASIVLAYLTYRWVELPVREHRTSLMGRPPTFIIEHQFDRITPEDLATGQVQFHILVRGQIHRKADGVFLIIELHLCMLRRQRRAANRSSHFTG
jgi:peptidoglycan/LPS O-acetylase OafA/YrhL